MPVELCLIVARRFDVEDACGGDERVLDKWVNVEAEEVGLCICHVFAVGIWFIHAATVSR